MKTFKITPASERIPPVVLHAPDDFSLGEQIGRHLIRHRALRPGIPLDAEVDSTVGRAAFRQRGINHPVTVTIEEQR